MLFSTFAEKMSRRTVSADAAVRDEKRARRFRDLNREPFGELSAALKDRHPVILIAPFVERIVIPVKIRLQGPELGDVLPGLADVDIYFYAIYTPLSLGKKDIGETDTQGRFRREVLPLRS